MTPAKIIYLDAHREAPEPPREQSLYGELTEMLLDLAAMLRDDGDRPAARPLRLGRGEGGRGRARFERVGAGSRPHLLDCPIVGVP